MCHKEVENTGKIFACIFCCILFPCNSSITSLDMFLQLNHIDKHILKRFLALKIFGFTMASSTCLCSHF